MRTELAVSILLLAAGCGDTSTIDRPLSGDLSLAPDLTVGPDLVTFDLAPAADLTPAPDMALPVVWTARTSGTAVNLYSMWGSAPTDLWVTGESGTMLHSTDGTSWTSVASGIGLGLRGIWGDSASDIYAVGDAGTLVHYDGKKWTAMGSGVRLDLNGIYGTGPMDIYAVGVMGLILHSTDGGMTWPSVPPLDPRVTSTMRQVLAIGQTVWAAGDDGNLIIHTDHFGSWQWILRNISSPENVYGICVVSTNPLSLWTAADDGSLRYSFDGLIWPRQPGAPLTPMRAIWGTSSDDVYAVGDGGLIMHLAKLHDPFVAQGSGTTKRLNAVWGSSTKDVYAVGEGGVILHHTP